MKQLITWTLVLMILVLPVSGSAVSWQEAVSNMMLSPSQYFEQDGLSASYENDVGTFTGGILDTFNITEDENGYGNFLPGHKYVLNNLTIKFDEGPISAQPFIIQKNGQAVSVEFNNVLFDGFYNFTLDSSGQGSQINVEFNGDTFFQDKITVLANSGGEVILTNNGTMSFEGNNPMGTGTIQYNTDSEGHFTMINNGTLVPGTFALHPNETDTLYLDAPDMIVVVQTTENELTEADAYTHALNALSTSGVTSGWINVLNSDSTQNYFFELNSDFNEGGSSGDDPSLEWVPSPYERLAHEMEEKRQAQACDNVTASPWWCYQLYMNYGSRNLFVRGRDGARIFHKSIVVPDGENKMLVLSVMGEEMDGVNIRVDASVLDYLERYDVLNIAVVSESKVPYMTYAVADLRSAREKYGLEPNEYLMVGAGNEEIMKGTDPNGEFVAIQ